MYNCASAERINLLELLISAGADLNITNNKGTTALGEAKCCWDDAATKDTAIQLLVSAGAICKYAGNPC